MLLMENNMGGRMMREKMMGTWPLMEDNKPDLKKLTCTVTLPSMEEMKKMMPGEEERKMREKKAGRVKNEGKTQHIYSTNKRVLLTLHSF